MLSFITKFLASVSSTFDFIIHLPGTVSRLFISLISFLNSLGAIGQVLSLIVTLTIFGIAAYIIYLIVKLVLSLIP